MTDIAQLAWPDATIVGKTIYTLCTMETDRLNLALKNFEVGLDAFEKSGIHDHQRANEKVHLFEALSAKMKKQDKNWARVALKVESLKYRANLCQKQKYNALLVDQLTHALSRWKQKTFNEQFGKENYKHSQCQFTWDVTEWDERIIHKLAEYPGYASKLLKRKSLQDVIFKFLIRDNYPVDVLVQYPAMTDYLYRCHLTASLAATYGFDGKRHIQVETNEQDETTGLVVRFYGDRMVNILTENEVKTGKNSVEKISNVFKAFKDSSTKVLNHGVFYDGIRQWNHNWSEQAKESGLFNDPAWLMKNVPPKEVISYQEFRERMKNPELERGDYYVEFVGTRKGNTRDLDGSHGFMTFYYPCVDGSVYVYPLGIFAEHFPTECVEGALFLGNTVKAVLSCNDPSYADLPGRTRGCSGRIFRTPEEKDEFHTKLQNLVLSKLSFQFGGKNCSTQTQKFVLGPDADYVNVDLLDVNAYPSIVPLIAMIRYSPEFLRPLVRLFILIILQGWKTFDSEVKNMFHSRFFRDGTFPHPEQFIRFLLGQVELPGQRKISGRVIFGHNHKLEPKKMSRVNIS